MIFADCASLYWEILPESSLTGTGFSDTWLHLPRGPVYVRKRREGLFTKDYGGCGLGLRGFWTLVSLWTLSPQGKAPEEVWKGVVLSFA